MPTVRLLDYGVGNLHSLTKALERSGLAVETVAAGEGPGDADGLVLPGVGAFQPAAEELAPGREAVRDAVHEGTPLLGVCLGMQLLTEGSAEGPGEGLGLVDGLTRPLDHDRLPHIGWNTLEGPAEGPLSDLDGRHVYYVHSFVIPDTDDVLARTTYGERFPALLQRDNVIATQFHPEKSSTAGRIVLDRFADLVEGSA
jgi:glutamine amidotransferase